MRGATRRAGPANRNSPSPRNSHLFLTLLAATIADVRPNLARARRHSCAALRLERNLIAHSCGLGVSGIGGAEFLLISVHHHGLHHADRPAPPFDKEVPL